MLCETADRDTALCTRFGFDSVADTEHWISTMLEATWDITADSCSRLAISDHNAIAWVQSSHGTLVVKWSRASDLFATLDASTRLLHTLSEHGIPVAAPIMTVNGYTRASLDGPTGALSVTVLPELSGHWLDITDQTAVHNAGASLADIHRVLGSVHHDPALASPRAAGVRERIETWLAAHDRGYAPDASRRLEALLPELPELGDEPQLVHNDFRSANILTRDSQVVGVLDFDEVVIEHRVSDLAKASVYLGTRFTNWRPTSPAVRRMLRAGYEIVRPLSPVEAHWFGVLVLWHAIMAIPSEQDAAGWARAV